MGRGGGGGMNKVGGGGGVTLCRVYENPRKDSGLGGGGGGGSLSPDAEIRLIYTAHHRWEARKREDIIIP